MMPGRRVIHFLRHIASSPRISAHDVYFYHAVYDSLFLCHIVS